ncbi:MAG: YIP1 family protein [Pyrinomonadaceae bacterium]
MNRFTGIIVAVVGVLIAVLSFLKFIPLVSTGVSLILLGLLVFGLSFVPKPATEDTPRMSTSETLGAIFYAPTEVFRNLRRHPRWLVVLLISAILSAVYINAFYIRLTPERIANFTVDKIAQSGFVPPEAVAKVREQTLETATNPISRAGQSVNSFVGLVFITAFVGLIFWLFGMVMGGNINYWQAFSATAYTIFPVSVITYILSLVILFIKDPDQIHPLIGQNSLVQDNLSFLVSSATNPVIFSLLSALSILGFYRLWLNAVGLQNAGERITPTIAWSAAITVWIAGLLLAVIMAMLFGNFLS